jgi:hypothetical protein
MDGNATIPLLRERPMHQRGGRYGKNEFANFIEFGLTHAG